MGMSASDRCLIERLHDAIVKPLRAAVDHLCVEAGVPSGSSAVPGTHGVIAGSGPVADKMVEKIVG
jgi:hypothetical protein